ncbi:hypothetical protein [Glycomyces tenuis]|uniref:hypothetical protein n=1 Tax=Glycomyces tenuis TaxID=58116 RepID=UPI00040C8BF0|nr:hypothetical protein [Glycomyces tenuis]
MVEGAGGEDLDLDEVPTKEEILELIEKLREAFIAMKVRALCKKQWKDLTITEEDQAPIGAVGETVDRGHIFEYSDDQYAHEFDSPDGESATGQDRRWERVWKVKWSSYTDCPVDADCDDQTAWGLGVQAKEWADTELQEWSERFSELLEDGDIASTEVLYLGMEKVHSTLYSAADSGADGSYQAIYALSEDGSEDWQGEDAKLAHEEYGGVIKQAGDNHTAMAQILRDHANNDLALQAAVHCALRDCVKQVHNTIRQKTYLDHYEEWDVLGHASVSVGGVALKFATRALGWVGFILTVADFAGVKVTIETTIERELNENQFEEIRSTVMDVLDETESLIEDTREELKREIETAFDPFFYGVASGDPAYIPGGGI